jgi:plastocyanin
MRRTLLLLAAVLTVGALAAGCGSSNDNSSSSSGSGSGSSGQSSSTATGGVTVQMKNIQFDPKTVTVKPGQTVTWENADTVDHNVVADSGANFKSDTFGRGGTYAFTPKKPGTIQYECTLHPGMVGTIEVR